MDEKQSNPVDLETSTGKTYRSERRKEWAASKVIDIAGQKFNRWTAVRLDSGKRWLFRCECGTEKVLDSYSVRTGGSKSCGCRGTTGGLSHGMSHWPEHRVWSHMIARCH